VNNGQRHTSFCPRRSTLHSTVCLLICVTVFAIDLSHAFRNSPLRLGRANLVASLLPPTFRSPFLQLSETNSDEDTDTQHVRDPPDNLIVPTGADQTDYGQLMATVRRAGGAGGHHISKIMESMSKKSERRSVDGILLPGEYDAIKDTVILSPYEVNRNDDQHDVHSSISNGFWNQDILRMPLGVNSSPSVDIDKPDRQFGRRVHKGDVGRAEMVEDQQLEISSSSDHVVVTDRPTPIRRQLSSSTGAGGAGRPVFNPTGW